MKINIDCDEEAYHKKFWVRTSNGRREIKIGDLILFKNHVMIKYNTGFSEGLIVNITEDVIIIYNYNDTIFIPLNSDYDLALVERF